jgi:hypothetical protein
MRPFSYYPIFYSPVSQEQRQSLLKPFMSVKLEFHDLDGLRWTQTALRRRQVRILPLTLPL